jgi:hypothetical protein
MVDAEEGNSWIYKNKDHGKNIGQILILWNWLHALVTGMLSAAASLQGIGTTFGTEHRSARQPQARTIQFSHRPFLCIAFSSLHDHHLFPLTSSARCFRANR